MANKQTKAPEEVATDQVKETPQLHTVSAGVPGGVKPTEAIHSPGDKVKVEKDGTWFSGVVVNVTPIGVADSAGEKVKYTITYDATNGVANYKPEQYVAQSRVKAADKIVETSTEETTVEEPTPEEPATPVEEQTPQDVVELTQPVETPVTDPVPETPIEDAGEAKEEDNKSE